MIMAEAWGYIFPFALLMIFTNCAIATGIDTNKSHLPIAISCGMLLFAHTFLKVILEGAETDITRVSEVEPLLRVLSSTGYQMVVTLIYLALSTWTLRKVSRNSKIQDRRDHQDRPVTNSTVARPAIIKKRALPSIFKS